MCSQLKKTFGLQNHFVPRLSLKHFANPTRQVCVYRTLVSHSTVPIWDEKGTKSIAWVDKLYTRTVGDQESGEIERWLDREFEQPAAEAIQRVVSDHRLYPEHWDALADFVAAQIVRTPAFLLRRYPEWRKRMPEIMNSVLHEVSSRSEACRRLERPLEPLQPHPFAEYVPMRVSTQATEKPGVAGVKVEVLVGRGYWHFVMHHVLTKTIEVLRNHRWSILKPCNGLTWFTSDDPVLALNYYGDGTYDFGGGWGRKGTEIYLPISPLHMLYTPVGEKPLRRGTTLDGSTTQMLRRFIAEHAHKAIFAAERDEEILNLRPREVSEERYRQEEEFWKTFAAEQATIEASWTNSYREERQTQDTGIGSDSRNAIIAA